MKIYINLIAVLLLTACGDSFSKPEEQVTNAAILQCGKDTDCKGDRVCNAGKCVSQTLAKNGVEGLALPESTQRVSSSGSSQPTPVCKPRDTRTKIPVWKPTIDSDGNLSSDPPQLDGMLVYIELFEKASKTSCKDSELNSFSRPNEVADPFAGGLAVNIRGNTQFANGVCYFRGYYMNEDVMGMHQGWTETYFKAVDKEKIVFSDKYCLAESVK